MVSAVTWNTYIKSHVGIVADASFAFIEAAQVGFQFINTADISQQYRVKMGMFYTVNKLVTMSP